MADNDTPADDFAAAASADGSDARPAGTTFAPATSSTGDGAGLSSASGSKVAQATHAVRDNAGGLRDQATDRVRQFAEDGKEKASGLLDQLAQLLTDAAGQVDEKLGAQYGDQARSAASSVRGFAQTVRDKDVDEVADDVRGFVTQSPGAALGIAAALGFALARVARAGLDQRS